MRDEGVPPPGHAKAWAFQQINPHLRCGPAPRREEKQRLQINVLCSKNFPTIGNRPFSNFQRLELFGPAQVGGSGRGRALELKLLPII